MPHAHPLVRLPYPARIPVILGSGSGSEGEAHAHTHNIRTHQDSGQRRSLATTARRQGRAHASTHASIHQCSTHAHKYSHNSIATQDSDDSEAEHGYGEGLIHPRAWGKKKSAYYSTDFIHEGTRTHTQARTHQGSACTQHTPTLTPTQTPATRRQRAGLRRRKMMIVRMMAGMGTGKA